MRDEYDIETLSPRKKPFADQLRQIAGSMALSGFELTETDKERILYLLKHPEKEDAILKALIEKHNRHEDEYDRQCYKTALPEYQAMPVPYSLNDVEKELIKDEE